MIFCGQCNGERTLSSVQSFTCPDCGTPTMNILHGKELEVFALEVEDVEEEEVRK